MQNLSINMKLQNLCMKLSALRGGKDTSKNKKRALKECVYNSFVVHEITKQHFGPQFQQLFSNRSLTLPNQRQKRNRGNPLTIIIWLTSEAIDWPELHKRRVHKVLNRPTRPSHSCPCMLHSNSEGKRSERNVLLEKGNTVLSVHKRTKRYL